MVNLKISAGLCFLEHLGYGTFVVCLSAGGEFLGGIKALDPLVSFDSHTPANKKQIGFPALRIE